MTTASLADRFAAVLSACLLVAVLVGVAATPAVAGDTVAIFSFEDDEIDADPGDTVTVDVLLRTYGGYGGEGIASVAFAIEYDPTVLTATDLERGPWLEGGEDSTATEIETTTEIDDDAGRARIEQTREPYGDGATGEAVIATITLEVSEDADPADAILEISDSAVTLVTDHPQGTMTREATVVIDGGGEPVANGARDEDGDGDENGDDPAGVTLADDADDSSEDEAEAGDGGDSSGEADSSDDGDGDDTTTDGEADDGEDDSDESDPLPGSGVLAALGGLVAVFLAVAGFRHRR